MLESKAGVKIIEFISRGHKLYVSAFLFHGGYRACSSVEGMHA